MVRSSLLATLILFMCLMVQAQTTIKGKLLDDKNNLPVGYTTIALLAAADSTVIKEQMADSTGNFELTNVAYGKYLLLFTSLGYQPVYKEIQSTTGTQHILDLHTIYMTVASGALNRSNCERFKTNCFSTQRGRTGSERIGQQPF